MRRFYQGSRAKTTIRNGRIPARLQEEIKEYLMKSLHPQAHSLLAYYASANLREALRCRVKNLCWAYYKKHGFSDVSTFLSWRQEDDW